MKKNNKILHEDFVFVFFLTLGVSLIAGFGGFHIGKIRQKNAAAEELEVGETITATQAAEKTKNAQEKYIKDRISIILKNINSSANGGYKESFEEYFYKSENNSRIVKFLEGLGYYCEIYKPLLCSYCSVLRISW